MMGNNIFDNVKAADTNSLSKASWDDDGPLAGIKIVECCDMVVGPMATCMLADQGASVTKCEFEDSPDPARLVGQGADKKMGSLFTAMNRNKKSFLMGDEKGFQDLIKEADVVVVDKRLEKKFGIDFNRARRTNRDITYVLIDHGKGEFYCQANSGLAGDQMDSDGKSTWMEGLHVSKVTSYYVSSAINVALYKGKPEHLKIDMMKVAVHYALPDIFWGNVWYKANSPKHFPNLDEVFRLVHLKDATVFTGALSDKEWNGLLKVFGHGGPESQAKIEGGDWDTINGP